jgi:predicted branched-subunit amino acid permease
MVMSIRNDKAPAEPCFTAAALRRGMIAALPFILSNGAAGLVIGVAYKGLGLGLAPSVLFSLLVYSATAQAVTLGLWGMPLPVGAMVVACVATNARYLVMGAHLHALFGGLQRRLMLPVLFLLADASWLMTTADAERNGPDAGYLLGASLPMAVGWIGGTALGYLAPLHPGGPLAAAATLLPLAFVVTLLPDQWRGRASLLPWAVSASAALLVARFADPAWAMLAGGGLGTAIAMAQGEHA